MSESMKAELARLRAELAETKRQNEKQAADAAKRSAIGMALARARVSDPNRVYDAIAAQVVEHHDGRWVAAENGVSRFGPDDGATYSLDRLVADVAGKSDTTADSPSHGQEGADGPNPFVKGPHYSVTAQMVMMKNDPQRAEHMQYLASVGRA